ncbi:CoA transferase [Bosea caraganae]|uniref:CoA transferase n=1 Tax=Bosea caraganae TaxID=2763117 RepID=A0A370L0B4_9HYPH|nr:CoA transferase [Bosea caraganae]RDJ20637.1 CoA transferase [Bosea caraganae]RDJ28914.1 CoA transferase [Bosea caraganae]
MSDSSPLVTKPLEGVRVLDLAHVLAGPYCTMLMALNGAEVIKVEPLQGEMFRHHKLVAKDGRQVTDAVAFLHRSKKAITLDLRTEKGKDLLKQMVATADVLVENFTPQTMRRLGLGYDVLREINPRLVYTSISGYGHDDILKSPYSDRPAFNIVAQAASGLMDITGEPGGAPLAAGLSLGDFVPAVFALSGTLMALRMRDLTGIGQHVDIAMCDCLASFSQIAITENYLTGVLPDRNNLLRGNPRGAFKVKDGYVVMTTIGDAMWARFCTFVGRPELSSDPRFSTDRLRGAQYDTVIEPLLSEWGKDKTRREVVDAFIAADLPAGPVQSAADLLDCPHMKARDMIVEVDDPVHGHLVMTGNPLKFSAVPEATPTPAPKVGQDTDEVLSALLGLREHDIADLRRQKII